MPRAKRVIWKKDVTQFDLPGVKRPRHFHPDAELPEETKQLLAPHLVPGALWRVAALFIVPENTNSEVEEPIHPYAHGYDWKPWGVNVCHERGALAIYLGTTRVEESARDRKISIPRHTFVVNGHVYLTRNLKDWEPVT